MRREPTTSIKKCSSNFLPRVRHDTLNDESGQLLLKRAVVIQTVKRRAKFPDVAIRFYSDDTVNEHKGETMRKLEIRSSVRR